MPVQARSMLELPGLCDSGELSLDLMQYSIEKLLRVLILNKKFTNISIRRKIMVLRRALHGYRPRNALPV